MAGGRIVKINEDAAIIGVGLFAFAKGGAKEAAAEYAVRGHGGTHHSGDGLGALDDVAEELLPVILIVTKRAQIEIHLQKVLRLEARIVLLGVLHAAKKEAGTDKSHERQRNFRNDQQAAQTIVSPTKRTAAAAGFQYLIDISAGSFDCWNNAEDQTGQHRNEKGESEHAGVEREINRAVSKEGWTERPVRPGRRATRAQYFRSEAGEPGGSAQRPSRHECSIPFRAWRLVPGADWQG